MRSVLIMFPLVLLAAACGSGDDDPAADSASDTTSTVVTASPATPPPTAATTVPTTTVAPTTAPATTAPATTAPATTTEPPAPTEPAPEVLGQELIGRWAHYDVVAYEDGDLKTLIISYGFNDFSEANGQIIDSASFCFSEQRTDQPIQTSLSDAATQAIKPPPTPIEVVERDGELVIMRAATPTPVGIRLDDPANESLPSDPSDPRIVDDDGDGQPGITVTITVSEDLMGELYIARREVFAWEATLVEPDRLEGVVTDDSEQLVIGASDPIFATSDANWMQFPDPDRNPIILERVDDTWDCERLAAERDELFPPTPDVDW